MDVNCGTILDGEESGAGMRRSASSRLMLRVASGERTKSEQFDFGGAEFAPWVLGRDDVGGAYLRAANSLRIAAPNGGKSICTVSHTCWAATSS